MVGMSTEAESEPIADGYVRFWIEHDTEVAMLTARDFRAAMSERDELRDQNKLLRAAKHCAWCDVPLKTQRWISMWFDDREVHCCSEEHLTLWLDTHRAIRDV